MDSLDDSDWFEEEYDYVTTRANYQFFGVRPICVI